MLILKRLIAIVLTPLLILLLFAAAVDYGVVKTIGQPAKVKKLVADSGVYHSIIPNLLNQQKNIQTSVGNIPLSDPVVKQAAEASFSPTLVQTNTEAAIDNIYAWLDGKTPAPTFKIDFSSAQGDLANNLAAVAQARAASLPVCKTAITSTSFDVYSATCLPKGVTPATVSQSIRDQINAGKGFIDKPVITAGDVKSDNGQSVFNTKLKDAPKQYQRFKRSPYILLLLAAVVATILFFVRPTIASGLRHVGIIFALIGVFMLFFAWAVTKANANVIQPKISLSNAVVSADVKKLATDIVQAIDKNYWVFGVIYTLIGVGLVATPLIINRTRQPKPTAEAPANTAQPSTIAEPKKPTKKSIKVQ